MRGAPEGGAVPPTPPALVLIHLPAVCVCVSRVGVCVIRGGVRVSRVGVCVIRGGVRVSRGRCVRV